uniref:Uncharacterized protein n=1 Tax=Pithovirus LCDPAC02 TaxID=2506601 RepID=A0A481YPL1_9VIRU|nr:MAG: hypothetical protein LCDPAC02_00860 [Pithovirus LCDPAC02]
MLDIFTKISEFTDLETTNVLSSINKNFNNKINRISKEDKELLKFLENKNFNLDNFINRLRCEQYDTKIFKITKFREIANEIIEEVVILEGFCPNDYDDNPYDILEYDDFHIEELAKLIINHSEVEKLLNTNENKRLDKYIKEYLSFPPIEAKYFIVPPLEDRPNFQDFLGLKYDWLCNGFYFDRFCFKLCELSETRYKNLYF